MVVLSRSRALSHQDSAATLALGQPEAIGVSRYPRVTLPLGSRVVVGAAAMIDQGKGFLKQPRTLNREAAQGSLCTSRLTLHLRGRGQT